MERRSGGVCPCSSTYRSNACWYGSSDGRASKGGLAASNRPISANNGLTGAVEKTSRGASVPDRLTGAVEKTSSGASVPDRSGGIKSKIGSADARLSKK